MTQGQQGGPVVVPAHGYNEPDVRAYESAPRPTGWAGWVFFAGILMVLAGCFNVIAGFVALFNDKYYVVPSSGLMVHVDYNAWGWTFLIYGAIVGVAGFGILAGKTWARVVGVVLAVVNALLNLAFLAAYPLWTTIIIALDIAIIYSLIVHGREVRAARD
jgi:hypothetical protein